MTLDTAVVGWALDPAQATSWHNYGHKIFSYGNPRVGVENPDIYRKNYGFALWNAGYDGAMNFAYQYQFGQSIWNDFDDATYPRYRDHVFAYPVTDGVIDTIQWEGFREGVEDTRYVASLIKKEGGSSSASAIVSNSLSQSKNMSAIQKNVINQILLNYPVTPTPTPTPTPARSLQLKTIAEGVETEEQRNILRLLRCDQGQGFYFSPPVSADEFEKLLG